MRLTNDLVIEGRKRTLEISISGEPFALLWGEDSKDGIDSGDKRVKSAQKSPPPWGGCQEMAVGQNCFGIPCWG